MFSLDHCLDCVMFPAIALSLTRYSRYRNISLKFIQSSSPEDKFVEDQIWRFNYIPKKSFIGIPHLWRPLSDLCWTWYWSTQTVLHIFHQISGASWVWSLNMSWAIMFQKFMFHFSDVQSFMFVLCSCWSLSIENTAYILFGLLKSAILFASSNSELIPFKIEVHIFKLKSNLVIKSMVHGQVMEI